MISKIKYNALKLASKILPVGGAVSVAEERFSTECQIADLRSKISSLQATINEKNRELLTIKRWIKVTHGIDSLPRESFLQRLFPRKR